MKRISANNFRNISISESVFLVKLKADDLQLYWKETPNQVFCCQVYEIFQDSFLQTTSEQLLLQNAVFFPNKAA